MEHIQLEFNLENLPANEMWISQMQSQIDTACESMGKVRRKLFAEMGEVRKMCQVLQDENKELKAIIRDMKNIKEEWIYGQNGCLFDVREA